MAGTTGLEPATSAVTGQRSNQLNYVPLPCITSRKALRFAASSSPSARQKPSNARSGTVTIPYLDCSKHPRPSATPGTSGAGR
jgi:hypothetical protein